MKNKNVVTERFFRTSKNKTYKYKSSVSKNMYIDILDDIVNRINNTYYRTIKIKPVDLKSRTYIEFIIENNKDPNIKVGDHFWFNFFEESLLASFK